MEKTEKRYYRLVLERIGRNYSHFRKGMRERALVLKRLDIAEQADEVFFNPKLFREKRWLYDKPNYRRYMILNCTNCAFCMGMACADWMNEVTKDALE